MSNPKAAVARTTSLRQQEDKTLRTNQTHNWSTSFIGGPRTFQVITPDIFVPWKVTIFIPVYCWNKQDRMNISPLQGIIPTNKAALQKFWYRSRSLMSNPKTTREGKLESNPDPLLGDPKYYTSGQYSLKGYQPTGDNLALIRRHYDLFLPLSLSYFPLSMIVDRKWLQPIALLVALAERWMISTFGMARPEHSIHCLRALSFCLCVLFKVDYQSLRCCFLAPMMYQAGWRLVWTHSKTCVDSHISNRCYRVW